VPAGPAQHGAAHRVRGRRLADAGPAPRVPVIPFAMSARSRWRNRDAIRYAVARDANNLPAVVAPLLGGVLNRVRIPEATAQEWRPLFFARPLPGPGYPRDHRGCPAYGHDDPRRRADHP